MRNKILLSNDALDLGPGGRHAVVANRASRCKGWLKSMRDDFGKNDTVQKTKA